MVYLFACTFDFDFGLFSSDYVVCAVSVQMCWDGVYKLGRYTCGEDVFLYFSGSWWEVGEKCLKHFCARVMKAKCFIRIDKK